MIVKEITANKMCLLQIALLIVWLKFNLSLWTNVLIYTAKV